MSRTRGNSTVTSVLKCTKCRRRFIKPPAPSMTRSSNRTRKSTRQDCWAKIWPRRSRVPSPNIRPSPPLSSIRSSKCVTSSISSQATTWRECKVCRSTKIRFWTDLSCPKEWSSREKTNWELILTVRRPWWQTTVIMESFTDISRKETRVTTWRPNFRISLTLQVRRISIIPETRWISIIWRIRKTTASCNPTSMLTFPNPLTSIQQASTILFRHRATKKSFCPISEIVKDSFRRRKFLFRIRM